MNNRTLSILVGLVALVLMTYLVIGLAKPCEGSYKFSLLDTTFECNLDIQPVIVNPSNVPNPKKYKFYVDSCWAKKNSYSLSNDNQVLDRAVQYAKKAIELDEKSSSAYECLQNTYETYRPRTKEMNAKIESVRSRREELIDSE